MSTTGASGEGPMRVGIPVADLIVGIFCAMGALTALLERDFSGQGQVGADRIAAGADLQAEFPGRALADGTGHAVAGDDHPTSIPNGVLKTSDGYINIVTQRQDLGMLRQCDRRAGTDCGSRLHHRPCPLERSRCAQR